MLLEGRQRLLLARLAVMALMEFQVALEQHQQELVHLLKQVETVVAV